MFYKKSDVCVLCVKMIILDEDYSYYDGSRVFTRLAEICGLSVDLVGTFNYILWSRMIFYDTEKKREKQK